MKRKIKKTLNILIILIGITIILRITTFASTIPNEEMENITAPNVLLSETDTGKILYEKNIDEKIYPASITKLMTAILVVENCELDDIVTVSENAVISVPSGYVNANLQIEEELTVNDLLHVMLIPSANDAANALAEHVAGSIESFSSMMNTKAKELGCTGSNFTNPSGLHQNEHYTTVRDLQLISKVAISNDTIRNIIKKTTYTLPKTNKYTGNSRIFTTTNYMIRENLTKYYSEYCIGGKTGYTEYAKNCVVEYIEKDNIKLTAIVMGEDAVVKGKKFLDVKQLVEYIYKNYETKNLAKSHEKLETIKIANGTRETKNLDVIYKNDINILEKRDINIDNVEKSIKYTKINAPITKGDIIGIIKYTYEGIEYETELIADNNVEESKFLRNTLYILFIMLIIYIIYNYKKINRKKKIRNNNYYRKRARQM